MARGLALAAAITAALLAVSGAGGAPAQTPKRGGTVVVLWPGGPPTCLNPFGPCNVPLPSPWLSQVLEGAFELGPDLTYRLVLASRVDTVSKEPFTLVYHIRPKARWSDGVPVSASDFAFTFRTFLRNELTAGGTGDTPELWRAIRRVVPLDAKTVRVVFRSRVAGWRDLFAMILPRHALAGQELTEVWRRLIDNPRTGNPIGSGPFLVQSFEPAEELSLVRNPRYWGPHTAYLDRLVFRVIRFPSEEAINEAFRTGEFDLAWNFQPPPEAFAAEFRSAGGRSVSTPASLWEHLAIRLGPGGHPVLERKLVRRALAYGIGRRRIVQLLWGEVAPDLRQLDSAVFVSNSAFYQPNWRMYRYRPALARRLLEQAGCRRGADGIYECAGERLSIRFMTTAGNTRRVQTLQLVQAQLRQAGFEVLPSYVVGSAFFDQVLPSGDFEVALFAWPVGPAGNNEVFRCRQTHNYYAYCSRLTNRDLVQTDLIVEEDQRARVLNAADRKLARDVPLIPLYQYPLFVSYRATIRNVVPHPQFAEQTWNSEDWWLAR